MSRLVCQCGVRAPYNHWWYNYRKPLPIHLENDSIPLKQNISVYVICLHYRRTVGVRNDLSGTRTSEYHGSAVGRICSKVQVDAVDTNFNSSQAKSVGRRRYHEPPFGMWPSTSSRTRICRSKTCHRSLPPRTEIKYHMQTQTITNPLSRLRRTIQFSAPEYTSQDITHKKAVTGQEILGEVI